MKPVCTIPPSEDQLSKPRLCLPSPGLLMFLKLQICTSWGDAVSRGQTEADRCLQQAAGQVANNLCTVESLSRDTQLAHKFDRACVAVLVVQCVFQ